MSFFPWKPAYSVHFVEMDNQHKKLVSLLNELYEAMQAGNGRQAVRTAMDGLTNYTLSHFADEERLMVSTHYPAYLIHKKEHDNFVTKVKEFQLQMESGAPGIALQVSTFLKTWLIDHIQVTDQKYSAHLNSKGII